MYHSFMLRLKSQLKLKILLLISASIVAGVPYFLLQRYIFFSVTIMPSSFIDKWISFNDKGIWLYQSLYFLTSFVALQFIEKEKLLQYSMGVILICIISYCFFLFVPTECPRPSANGTCTFYQRFVTIESPLNAFPSLHVALAMYAALSATYYTEINKIWRFIVWFWALAIVYSTLITKQHVMIDVLGGGVLAIIIYKIGKKEGMHDRFYFWFNKISCKL